jgi:hypothetical protein
MEINLEVKEILRESKINMSQGLLCLLGIYFGLDIDTTCDPEVVKAINLTKIVEKDYKTNSLVWNVPLFEGQATAFDWVKDWIEGFGKINKERKGSWRDATKRMQDFFRKYPEYRKDDVYRARDAYFKSLAAKPNGFQFCMNSHKFIFDGIGAMKKSELLSWCEKLNVNHSSNQQKGRVIN